MGRCKLPKQRPDIGPPYPLLYRFNLRPESQQRPRSKVTKAGKLFYWMPSQPYENAINAQANAQHNLPEPFTADLAVVINLRLPHRRHGDVDNMVKSILDGMSPKYKNGERVRMGVFRSDKMIKKLHVEIFYDGALEDACSEVIVYRHESRAWLARLRMAYVGLWERLTSWLA